MKKKLLILEDDENILNNLVELFESEGYEVFSGADGSEGVEHLKSVKPNLILCDIMMPKIDGYEFYKIVKDNFETKFIPFIFLTAQTDLLSIRAGLNLGVDDYITKPFAISDILKTVEVRIKKQIDFDNQFNALVKNIDMYIPHELRTPLVAIMGFGQLLVSDIDTMERNEIKEMTERILWSAQRLHGRIEKFIAYSDLNLAKENIGRKQTASVTRLDNDFMEKIISSHYTLRNRMVSIKTMMEPVSIPIPGVQLERLFIELLENAVKFSMSDSPIIVQGIIDKPEYNVQIKDNGIGMDENEIKNIGVFQQFSREDHSQQGNGLGLAISKKIVQIYNGSFSIESEKDNFTTVKLKLPINR